MTKEDFIDEIQNSLTVYGSLPRMLPDLEINRIIEKQANYFYDNYPYSFEDYHYIVNKEIFATSEFKRSRTLILPDCVIAVDKCNEINQFGRLGVIDKDFSEARLLASEIFLTSFAGDDLVLRVANAAYYDITKAFFLVGISYDFNKNTRKLKITGRDPRFDVYIQGKERIPLDRLCDDINFLDWCTAHAKISFARLVGTYKMSLPGNVNIDGESYKSEGEAKIQELKEYFDKNNPPNYFLIWH